MPARAARAKVPRICTGTLSAWGRSRGRHLATTGSGMAQMPIDAGTSRARSTQNVSLNGDPAHCDTAPANRGPQPRPPMFATVATNVARARRLGGVRSTRVAVAVPVKMPADSPDRTRPAISRGSPSAIKKVTALSAANASPASSSGRRPSWSDSRPNKNSDALTPAAYVAKITVIVSSDNPKRCRYRSYSGVGNVVPSIATASANAVADTPRPCPSVGRNAVRDGTVDMPATMSRTGRGRHHGRQPTFLPGYPGLRLAASRPHRLPFQLPGTRTARSPRTRWQPGAASVGCHGCSGPYRPRRLPNLPRRQRVRLDRRRAAIPGRPGRLRRRGWHLHRHLELVSRRARRLRDDHRALDGRPRHPRPGRRRHEGRRRSRTGSQPARRDDQARGARLPRTAADRTHRPLLRALRRPGDTAGGVPARLRRAGASGDGAPP